MFEDIKKKGYGKNVNKSNNTEEVPTYMCVIFYTNFFIKVTNAMLCSESSKAVGELNTELKVK